MLKGGGTVQLGGPQHPTLTKHLDPEGRAHRDAPGDKVAPTVHAVELLDRNAARKRRAREAAQKLKDCAKVYVFSGGGLYLYEKMRNASVNVTQVLRTDVADGPQRRHPA